MEKKKRKEEDVSQVTSVESETLQAEVSIGPTATISGGLSKPQTSENIPTSKDLHTNTITDNRDLDQKQRTLFDDLAEPVQERLEEEGKKELAVEYTDITSGENKLIHAINSLLYDQNKTDETGNILLHEENQIQRNKHTHPILKVSPQQLCKEYTGKRNPSGKDREEVYKLLEGLRKERPLVWEIKKPDGNKEIQRDVEPYLIFGSRKTQRTPITDESEEEEEEIKQGKNTRKTQETEFYYIELHPIFNSHPYILRPRDLEEKTAQILGKKRYSRAIQRLRDYLLSFIATQKKQTQIREVTLIYKLGLEKEYKRRGRGSSRIQGKIEQAIETCLSLSLLKGYRITQNVTGEYIYTFYLNEHFYEDYPPPLDEIYKEKEK